MRKLKILYKILKASNCIQILFGFSIFLVISACIINTCEPQVKSFGDSLWFCFISVTTIGYGDFYAVTALGRIVIVILAAYGILVTALVTGSIVNYITELQKARVNESVTVFLQKLEHLEDLSKEELSEISKKIRERKY